MNIKQAKYKSTYWIKAGTHLYSAKNSKLPNRSVLLISWLLL